jgi:hypothetical protein
VFDINQGFGYGDNANFYPSEERSVMNYNLDKVYAI